MSKGHGVSMRSFALLVLGRCADLARHAGRGGESLAGLPGGSGP